jgi:periplasmic divalent cation tolerance protein
MKSAQKYAVVLVTAPDLRTARQLVRLALEARLVACGNIVPRIESHYWWQGKIDTSKEVLVLFKTLLSALAGLEKLILAHHPYQTPEIIALPLKAGTEPYLRWILDNARATSRARNR